MGSYVISRQCNLESKMELKGVERKVEKSIPQFWKLSRTSIGFFAGSSRPIQAMATD